MKTRSVGRSNLPALLLLFVASATAGCSSTNSAVEERGEGPAGRLRIVTTVAPITNIASNVVGDLADVVGVVPEGTNSHTFEPPPSAAEELSRADLIFINGLMLEEPTKKLAGRNLKRGSKMIELGNKTISDDEYLYDFSFPREGAKPNPHLWTDPTLARRYAEIIKDEVSRADPGNAGRYAANFNAFGARIDAFDNAMRASFATIPPEDRKLLTYHDAYAYFAKNYGWTVLGAIQVSDFRDPTPKEVGDLIDQVRTENVQAIFGSEVFPSPVLEQIGRETGVRYVDVLRDDDLLGKPGDPEHSWMALMRFNFVTMVESLGGDASALKALDVSSVAPDEASYPQ